jgi:hypothetical protein
MQLDENGNLFFPAVQNITRKVASEKIYLSKKQIREQRMSPICDLILISYQRNKFCY